jgi:hypothetical protein
MYYNFNHDSGISLALNFENIIIVEVAFFVKYKLIKLLRKYLQISGFLV